MNIKLNIASIALLTALLMGLGGRSPVFADPYQPTEPTKDVLIDKMVGTPTSSSDPTEYNYVDNLTSNDYLFKPGDAVYFRLRVKNTSQAKLTDVVVKDFEPSYFGLVSDPGTVSDGVLTIQAGNFEPGEEKVYIVRGRVDEASGVPAGTTCITNRAHAEDDGIVDDDTAQFCFRKSDTTSTTTTTTDTKGSTTVPLPAKVPNTGAKEGFFILISACVLAYIGIRLHRSA